MARIELNKISYTQINTDATSYITQNHSPDVVNIVVSDTQPDDDALPDFQLEIHDVICDKSIIGILWGKTTQADKAFMGIKEG